MIKDVRFELDNLSYCVLPVSLIRWVKQQTRWHEDAIVQQPCQPLKISYKPCSIDKTTLISINIQVAENFTFRARPGNRTQQDNPTVNK